MPPRRPNWANLVNAFEGAPGEAYDFARALYRAQHGLTKEQGAIIDEMIEALFPHTEVYKACHRLYWLAIQGRLHPKHYPPLICDDADPKWRQTLVAAQEKSINRKRR
jgi:hypothetical protein